MASFRLDGRVALVTGGASGIGKGIAIALAEAGAAVAVQYLTSKEGADEITDCIRKKGGKTFAVQADLTTSAAADRVVAETVSALGGLDVLVNSPLIYTPARSVTGHAGSSAPGGPQAAPGRNTPSSERR